MLPTNLAPSNLLCGYNNQIAQKVPSIRLPIISMHESIIQAKTTLEYNSSEHAKNSPLGTSEKWVVRVSLKSEQLYNFLPNSAKCRNQPYQEK